MVLQTPIFSPTRISALHRLAEFLPHAGRHYAATRNTDFGPADRSNVSALSPFIRRRMITEEEVLAAVLARHSLHAAEKFVQEVFWRTYFKGHLETRPAIWTRYRDALAELTSQLDRDERLSARYLSAIQGQTGIDCFDAWVGDLVTSGYLHNHARMWLASIWIFTLRLPWELGADFMYRHLLDGDPASNTLSWRWVGGLHTKGKTYLARRDNINHYTGGRFSPVGLSSSAIALEEPPLPRADLPPKRRPVPARGKAMLLLTEEDMHPVRGDFGELDIMAIAGGLAVQPISNLVSQFADAAMNDAITTAASHFACPAERLASLDHDALADCAERHGANSIVTPYVPTGHVRSRLDAVIPKLQSSGITVHEVQRIYDALSWPHATRGFFAMREKIPEILNGCGIGAGQMDMFDNA